MQTNNKKILNVVLCICLLYTSLYIFDTIFTYFIPKNLNRKPYWILSKESQKYDYVVLGSSRTNSALIPDSLENYLNCKKVINISLDGTSFQELYLVFKKFSEQNTIHNLILGTDIYSLDNKFFTLPFHAYYYLPLIKDTSISPIIANYFGKKYWIFKHVPFTKYAAFNSQIGLQNLISTLLTSNKNYYESSSGYYFQQSVINKLIINNIPKYYSNKIIEVDKVNLYYFNKIVALCKVKKIKLYFINIPEYYAVFKYQRNRENVLDIYRNISNKYKILFVNFDNTLLCKDSTKFSNITHMNFQGACEVTKQLSFKIIQEKDFNPKNEYILQ